MTRVTSLRFIKRLLVYIRTSDRRLLAHELLNYKPYLLQVARQLCATEV